MCESEKCEVRRINVSSCRVWGMIQDIDPLLLSLGKGNTVLTPFLSSHCPNYNFGSTACPTTMSAKTCSDDGPIAAAHRLE